MPIKKPHTRTTPVDVFRITAKCTDEKCNGEMVCTEAPYKIINSETCHIDLKESYIHKCADCGWAECFDREYPYIKYESSIAHQKRMDE